MTPINPNPNQWLRRSHWVVAVNLDLLSLSEHGAPAVLGKSNLGYSPWGEMEQSLHRYALPVGVLSWLLVRVRARVCACMVCLRAWCE